MKALIRGFLSLCLFLIVFFLGIYGGLYYPDQIFKVLSHFGIQQPQIAPEVTTLPPVDRETQSLLKLPNLPEPIPLVFGDTLDEAKIQEELKSGAVVLPLGPTFGGKGNVVVTAHSSGTASFGPYRFAFTKLSDLQLNQEFTVSTPKVDYVYRVYSKDIVWPTDVDKLPKGDKSTVTLVTCWPIWTSFKRLLVNAELVNTMNKI